MNTDRVKFIRLVAMCFALFMSSFDDNVMNMALPKIQMSQGSA
jgi:hypothetical protein